MNLKSKPHSSRHNGIVSVYKNGSLIPIFLWLQSGSSGHFFAYISELLRPSRNATKSDWPAALRLRVCHNLSSDKSHLRTSFVCQPAQRPVKKLSHSSLGRRTYGKHDMMQLTGCCHVPLGFRYRICAPPVVSSSLARHQHRASYCPYGMQVLGNSGI